MKIQFLIVIAALFICCCLGGEIASQSPGNERKANSATASSDAVSTAPSPTKQNEFNWRGKVSAGGIIEIFGVKGDIRAEASAGNEVEVVAQKFGDRDEINQVAVRVEETEGKVRICAAYPTLEGKGDAECLESLEWRSSEWNDGRELRLRYRDGKRQNIRLAEVQGQFKVRIPAGVRFIARTLRGDITASFGTANISSPIDLYTLGGNVSLEAPKAFNARVRLTTGGEISTDFPITVLGRFPGNGLEGNIGQGGMKISLRSESGNIELRRASVAEGAQQVSVTEPESVKAPESMPTVDQILDRYVQAIGGAAAHRKLTSRVMKSTLVIEDSDVTASFEGYRQAPNRAVEIGQFKLGDGREFEVSRGFNGAVGWALNPTDNGFRELSGTELAEEKRDSEFYWEIKLKELYPKMALLGQVKVGDHTAYCIEATPPEGHPLKLYFEAQTGLLVRIDSISENVSKGKIPEETYYEDYREVDGIKLPFIIRLPVNKYTFKVHEVKHNVPIEEAKFKSPDPARAALSAATTDEYLQVEMKKRRIPGLALVVIKNGEVVKLQGYGLANLEHEAPVTPDTVFELASVTKQFTATAIMRLVEQGKLKLDDPITLRLPSAPTKWNGITIRHLLTHTSGLAGGFSDSPYTRTDVTTSRLFRSVTEAQMSSAPGTRFEYSDPDYFLLGMIIEKASGQRYQDFLAEQFFRPQGMTSTSIIDQWSVIRHRAAGYTIRNGQIVNIRRIRQEELPSHWGALSTVRDFAKWEMALAAGRVVKEASLAEMWTSVKLKNGQSHPYGFGWMIEQMGANRVITHGGMSGTEYTRLPDDRLTVIVLTNLGYRYFDTVDSWGLTKGIARRYLAGLP
jgi:CubicO group peptidase (beta-lactamase class C family)